VQTSSEHTQLTMLGPPQLPSVSIFAFPETNAELQLLFGEDGTSCRPHWRELPHSSTKRIAQTRLFDLIQP
jgi:hypothetical protein